MPEPSHTKKPAHAIRYPHAPPHISRQQRDDADRTRGARRNAAVLKRQIRQRIEHSLLRPGSSGGGRQSAASGCGADQLTSRRDHLHLGRYRIEQPRDPRTARIADAKAGSESRPFPGRLRRTQAPHHHHRHRAPCSEKRLRRSRETPRSRDHISSRV